MAATMKQMKNSSLSTHALIITGGSREGRMHTARELGAGMVRRVGQGVSPTTFTSMHSAGSITREIVTGLLHDLSMSAFGGEFRIVIFEDAETMTPEAGNALLKMLEEPPENVACMLLAPTAAQIMPTLRSRSQIISIATESVQLEPDHPAADFFRQTIPQRFASIAELSDRSAQLEFAKQLLHISQVQQVYGFAGWMQQKLVQAQKSGNIRLLLETSAVIAGEVQHV